MGPIERQLKATIKSSGLSINAIAQATGVPQSALHRFVHGQRGITLPTADKLAAFFDLRLTKVTKRSRR